MVPPRRPSHRPPWQKFMHCTITAAADPPRHARGGPLTGDIAGEYVNMDHMVCVSTQDYSMSIVYLPPTLGPRMPVDVNTACFAVHTSQWPEVAVQIRLICWWCWLATVSGWYVIVLQCVVWLQNSEFTICKGRSHSVEERIGTQSQKPLQPASHHYAFSHVHLTASTTHPLAAAHIHQHRHCRTRIGT